MKRISEYFKAKHAYPSIPRLTLFYMALRNVMHHKLRSVLTLLGIVIGIGSIYFLLSFGLGLQQLVTDQVIGNQSLKSIDISTQNSKIIKLDGAVYDKVRNLPHVARAGTTYAYAGGIKAKGGNADAIVYGPDVQYQAMEKLVLRKGRLLKRGDDTSALANVVALRAIGLGDISDALGKKITIRVPFTATDTNKKRTTEMVKTFTIVGVLDSSEGNEVFIPAHFFQTAGVSVFSNIRLEADKGASVAALRRQVESMGLLTSSPSDTVGQVNQMFTFFNLVLAGFGAIGMIVAVLGMFNTLTISLLERTQEIGLMVALGGRHRDMRRLFIAEAMVLSVIGAVCGVLAAMLGGMAINIAMNNLARGRGVVESFSLFTHPPLLVAGILFFMMFVGMVVVYFPARRASHINPIDALRRE